VGGSKLQESRLELVKHWLLRHHRIGCRDLHTLVFANTFRGLYIRQIALIQEYGGQLDIYRRRNEGRSPMRLPDEPDPPLQINVVRLIDVCLPS